MDRYKSTFIDYCRRKPQQHIFGYIDSGQYEEKYPNVRRIELRVSFLFEEPKLCHRLLEKAKHVFMNVFENVEMIVENGEIKEGEIYGQGSF